MSTNLASPRIIIHAESGVHVLKAIDVVRATVQRRTDTEPGVLVVALRGSFASEVITAPPCYCYGGHSMDADVISAVVVTVIREALLSGKTAVLDFMAGATDDSSESQPVAAQDIN